MQKQELASAIKQICGEKGISEKEVISSIEAALGAAYRKEYRHQDELVESEFDVKTGAMKFYQVWEVVADEEELTNNKRQIFLADAKKKKKTIKEGESIRKKLPTKADFGRIAAQTAKQVILQQVREAERTHIFESFKDKEGEVLNGVVQQVENQNVIVDLGSANGIMFENEQIPEENYRLGQRLKVYLKEVEKSPRGSLIKLSRTHPKLISYLFKSEVPEIDAGTVKIKDVVREAGRRTKMSVISLREGVDPVGSCVGQRGTRVQSVLAEIGNEKIDIIPYDKDPKVYIKNALSPAKVLQININEKKKTAEVKVDEDQLSLAIGKQGQNVRLASKLAGYEIDIIDASQKEGKEETTKKASKINKRSKKKIKIKKKTVEKTASKAKKKVTKKTKK